MAVERSLNRNQCTAEEMINEVTEVFDQGWKAFSDKDYRLACTKFVFETISFFSSSYIACKTDTSFSYSSKKLYSSNISLEV